MFEFLVGLLKALWSALRWEGRGEHRQDFRLVVKGLRELIAQLREELSRANVRIDAVELNHANCEEQHRACEDSLAELQRESRQKHQESLAEISRLKKRVEQIENGH